MFGFFCNGVFAMSLELGVETTYPVEETISATLIYVTGEWHYCASPIGTGPAEENHSDCMRNAVMVEQKQGYTEHSFIRTSYC